MHEHGSQAWLEARRCGIGGSDWVHAMGIDPYGCSRYLIYDKRGIKPDYEPVETGAMERGTMMEPVVAEKFVKETQASIICKPDLQQAPGLPEWWIANLDGIVFPKGPFKGYPGPGALEFKTKAPHVLSKLKRDGVSDGEVLQFQHYMTFADVPWGVHFALDPLCFKRHHTTMFESDPELVAKMLIAGERVWKWVEHGPMPERLEIDDSRCRECVYRLTCQGERLAAIGLDEPTGDYVFSKNESLPRLIAEHLELKVLRNDIEGLIEAKKEEIDTTVGTGKWQDPTTMAKAVVSDKRSVYLDQKRLRAEKPEITEEYTTKGIPKRSVLTYPGRKS